MPKNSSPTQPAGYSNVIVPSSDINVWGPSCAKADIPPAISATVSSAPIIAYNLRLNMRPPCAKDVLICRDYNITPGVPLLFYAFFVSGEKHTWGEAAHFAAPPHSERAFTR